MDEADTDKAVDELIRRARQIMAYSNYRSIYGENYELECIAKEVERMKEDMSEIITRDEFDAISNSVQQLYASSSGKRKKIVDVNIIVPNKVVEVTFIDGDKQKAVCQEPDVFSLEQAISICLTKHLLGGTGVYNKAVKNGMKVYDNKLKADNTTKAEEDRIAKRRAKKMAYMKRRAEKRREEQIEIQKEAYVRAMREVSASN